jgi:thiol-disulfide isomerase/thioredoxin
MTQFSVTQFSVTQFSTAQSSMARPLPRALALAAVLLAAGAGAATPPAAATPVARAGATQAAAGYLPYTPAAFAAASGRQRVLFFHATWCPSCRATDADIVKNLARIPANVVIFRTDYDTQAALKKQYGITSQHTFVLVDGSGKALRKWAGGKLNTILSQTRADPGPGRN